LMILINFATWVYEGYNGGSLQEDYGANGDISLGLHK
jgi:hypothetical protein